MVYVSWSPVGFLLGIVVSLMIFSRYANRENKFRVIETIIAICILWAVVLSVENVQAILASTGVRIDSLMEFLPV